MLQRGLSGGFRFREKRSASKATRGETAASGRAFLGLLVLTFVLTFVLSAGTVSADPFRRGDVDGDGQPALTDAVYLLNSLFLRGPVSSCADAADTDDNGALDLTDAVYLLNFLFLEGPGPALPGPFTCGDDPTADALGCEEYRDRGGCEDATEHSLSIEDASAVEGDDEDGDVEVRFNVTLEPASAVRVSVEYRTEDGSASSGRDYEETTGTLRFDPGETAGVIRVAVRGDTRDEGNETFRVVIEDPVGAVLGRREATGTIIDDDGDSGLAVRPEAGDCVVLDPPGRDDAIALERAFPDLDIDRTLTAMAQVPGDDSRWYVLERQGRVLRFQNDSDVSSAHVVLDLRDRVEEPNDGGLTGIAFHPEFGENGEVYLFYTGDGDRYEIRIARFESRDGGESIDEDSEDVLLALDMPTTSHAGGHLAFGPDGFLYVSIGDTGDRSSAQDRRTLKGKLLRIDVDRGSPYAIPGDNPFVDRSGEDEIWAIGFRNPYRFTFDRATGDLWLGDVGQTCWEEINRVERGKNYGWAVREGEHCRQPSGVCEPLDDCNDDFEEPVYIHAHPEVNAIIVGHVYRGEALHDLEGALLYADYKTGRIFALTEDDGEYEARLLYEHGPSIYSFAEDEDGELYVLADHGVIYRLVPPTRSRRDPVPERLSDFPCVDPDDSRKAGPGMIPYDVNLPFWSEDAEKERYFALPDDARITILPDGDLEFPAGTVFLKHFHVEGELVETRVLARHGNGEWGGYSYEWNGRGTDATLLEEAKVKEVGGRLWTYPSRRQCLVCHTEAAGFSLGLELGQLNREFRYPSTGKRANQLETYEHIGLFDGPLPDDVDDLPAFSVDDGEPLEWRARSYLHVNCSNCHRPGGGGMGSALGGAAGTEIDFRYFTPLGAIGICEQPPRAGVLGTDDALLLVPGDTDRSILRYRINSTSTATGMPPIGKHTADRDGRRLLDDWIESLRSCR